MSEVYKKRSACAICGNTELDTILNYGQVPLAGYFPSKDEIDREELFPLCVVFCSKCYLVQTDSIIDADKLFRDYRYMSSIGLQKHFDGVAKMLVERFNLNRFSGVVEIGSNDGVLLKPLIDLGVKHAIGFEPAVNISKVAESRGCAVINDYFNYEKAQEYLIEGTETLIVSNNCFAHIDDIKSIVRGVKFALKDGGHFVIEVSYLKDLIEKLQYDNIYHEHIYYYSLNALKNLFDQFDMTIVDYEMIPIHSGSIRVFIKNAKEPLNEKVQAMLNGEKSMGLTSLDYFKEFNETVVNHISVVRNVVLGLKTNKSKIIGYGASGRANMLCNAAGLTPDLVDFIVDESPERAGRFIAGTKIPIVNRDALDSNSVDHVIVFAWNFYDMIKEKLKGRGYTFVTFFPGLKMEKV